MKINLNEIGKAAAEPLHWVIDRHSQNCVLLKRGRRSVVAIDYDGKNYTVMLDPKERDSLGCQRATFKDAAEMAQKFLDGTLEGGRVPECPSNIRRWLKHGQDKAEPMGVKESDEWEKATSCVPEDYLEWEMGSKPGAAYLKRRGRNYIKIVKRLPSAKNSEFYQKWVKEHPYAVEFYAYSIDRSVKSPVTWEASCYRDALALARKLKLDDFSANALNFPEMPEEIKLFLRKGRTNPRAESLSEAAGHVFSWEVYKKNANRVSLILDGRYEVAAVYRNEDERSAAKTPYIVDVYSFTHACELRSLEKSIQDAVAAIAKALLQPTKLDGDPQMAGVEKKDVKIPPMPTKARLWLDMPFQESVLSEKQ